MEVVTASLVAVTTGVEAVTASGVAVTTGVDIVSPGVVADTPGVVAGSPGVDVFTVVVEAITNWKLWLDLRAVREQEVIR